MRILFQGDSITDCGRNREVEGANRGLGDGYVNLIASELLCDHPEYQIFNRAVDGNRIGDMYARWIEDALHMEFDVISILNGINDVGFGLRCNRGASKEEYAFLLDRMLYQVKETHPHCKMILIEPFVVPFDLRKITPEIPDAHNDIFFQRGIWEQNVRERGEVVKQLAEKYHATFLSLFDDFVALAETYGGEKWSLDCIHPTPGGHALIARKWLDAFASL